MTVNFNKRKAMFLVELWPLIKAEIRLLVRGPHVAVLVILLARASLRAQTPAPASPPSSTAITSGSSNLGAPAEKSLATSPQQQVEQLRSEVERLRAEVERLRALVEAKEKQPTVSSIPPPAAPAVSPPPEPAPDSARIAIATKAQGGDLSGAGNLLRTDRITIGGYGDFQFRQSSISERADGGGTPTFQNTRFVLSLGAVLAEKQNIVFNSEIEYEFGSREIDVEQAYVEWKARPQFAFRGGIIVPAIGRFNTFHDSSAHQSIHHSDRISRRRDRHSWPLQTTAQDEAQLRSRSGKWHARRKRRWRTDAVLAFARSVFGRRTRPNRVSS
jgi:hypothetical protein